jgi:hypothetical protein
MDKHKFKKGWMNNMPMADTVQNMNTLHSRPNRQNAAIAKKIAKNKNRLIERLRNKGIFSEDVGKALQNLDADTVYRGYSVLEKLHFVLRTCNILHSSLIVKMNPALYVASSIDVEFPLLLGVRDIHLLDFGYSQGKMNVSLDNKLAGYRDFAKKGPERSISFDFGAGDEKIKIRTISRNWSEFKSSQLYGLHIEHLGPKTLFYSPNSLGCVLPGGFFICTQGDFRVDGLGSSELDRFSDDQSSDIEKFLDKNEEIQSLKYGLRFIRTGCGMAFYEKVLETRKTSKCFVKKFIEMQKKRENMFKSASRAINPPPIGQPGQ